MPSNRVLATAPRAGRRAAGAALLCVVVLVTLVTVPRGVEAATVPAGFTHTTYAGGLSRVTSMAFAPDGRLFVTEQSGAVRVIRDGVVNSTPFVRLDVDHAGERGLGGIAFDPNFATNKFVYLYYTAKTPAPHNRVSRFVANGDVALAGSETTLLDLDNLSSLIHMGGALNFGQDGRLYVAVGDNGTPSNAQSFSTLLGKMLRIGADGSIPSDNPYFTTTTGRNRAIWGLGLRNPFTFAVQPGSGRIFINDVGQASWEEINDGIRAANYGWPETEGPTDDPRFRSPFYAYPTSSTSCAVTGGAFYNPATPTFPTQYVGSYFFADFCGSWIKRLDPATRTVSDFVTATHAEPVDIEIGPDGALYYLSRAGGTGGNVVRVGYSAPAQPPSITRHPASQTVSVGRSATFSVEALGTPPLSYQWQRNGVDIPGAASSTYTLASATSGDNGARFRAVVRNAAGSATSADAVLTVTSDQPPTSSINTPAAGTTYAGGDVVQYAGTASDPETGSLPPSAFTWWVDFHHDTHTHPFVPPTTGSQSGQFSVPTTGETSANVWYRIHLSVRDRAGLVHESARDIGARISMINLQTVPAGLQLNLDDQPHATPYAVPGVVGVVRKLEAPASQVLDGVAYEFASWSDGGARVHTVSTQPQDTTYVATYRAVTSSASPTPTTPAPPATAIPTSTTPAPPATASAPPPAGSPTTTAVRPPVNRTVRITKVQYNPRGRDTRLNINREYLRLKNVGARAVTLTRWSLRDAGGSTYTFPRTRLAAGASITLFTGRGTRSSTKRYWGRTRHVWNNTGRESATLRDAYRRTVDVCRWTSRPRGYTYC